MANTAALMIAALALPAVAAARGAESDPARRSLVVEAVEKASPAVVNVSTEQIVEQRRSPFPFPQDPFFEEFFRDFADPRPRRFKTTSLGSGVIVAADGTIMTNVHVIERASRIHVTLADQRELDATLVGADADADIAIVRVKAGGDLPHIPFGSSAELMIGESVIAIGNPFGLSHTVTTGVVSAVGRSLRDEDRTYTDFIQTDASINPGNSGGPLLDIKGELIGINTAIYGKAQGIGFAIPVDRAQRVMKDLVSYGEVRHAWVGLVVQYLTPDLAQHFGVRRRDLPRRARRRARLAAPRPPGRGRRGRPGREPRPAREPRGAHRRPARRPAPRARGHAAPLGGRAPPEDDRGAERAQRAALGRAGAVSVQRERALGAGVEAGGEGAPLMGETVGTTAANGPKSRRARRSRCWCTRHNSSDAAPRRPARPAAACTPPRFARCCTSSPPWRGCGSR